MQKMQENFFQGLTSQQAYETSSWNKTLSMQRKFMFTLTLSIWGPLKILTIRVIHFGIFL